MFLYKKGNVFCLLTPWPWISRHYDPSKRR